MANKKAIGLSSLVMGAIAGDGGMGTVLTALGATVSDSAVIGTEEGTTTDFNIEESDAPYYTIESAPGKQTLTWSTYDVATDTLARLFGGTAALGVWEMPDQLLEQELSVRITSKDGWIIDIPRLKLRAKLTWNLKKTALAQVDIVGTVLQPTKAGTKKMKFTEPA